MKGELLHAEEAEPPGRQPGLIQTEELHSRHGITYTTKKVLKHVLATTQHNGNSSRRILSFKKRFFAGASASEWNDWHWQIQNRIRSLSELERIIHLTKDERNAFKNNETILPFAITPYYAALIDPDDPAQALRRTVVPVTREYVHERGESEDPLKEELDSPVSGLVHRYPDRVLFLVTDFCSTYCRYCTRSRIVGQCNTDNFNRERLRNAIDYIESHEEIRDVLISGGDPLTMADEKLEWVLTRLRRIPHIEILRIGTKAPVVLPQRITPELVRMIKRFHPLWMSIHFTHPDELTAETRKACVRLAGAGIPLQSQTVLLSGINDDVNTMKRLFHGLVSIRVRPYYIYQCDPILGSSHFRTPIKKGLEIIQGLRGYTSGFAVPMYVVDAPGGGGKIPLMPEYVLGHDGNNLIMQNYEGNIYRYYDPSGIAFPHH